MKTNLRILLIPALVCLTLLAQAQCGAGYTQAILNWDNLCYYYNSGNNVAPYGFSTPSSGNYVSNAMEQTQRFALGPVGATFSVSAAGVVKGQNGSHTGDISNYTGDDAQFT